MAIKILERLGDLGRSFFWLVITALLFAFTWVMWESTLGLHQNGVETVATVGDHYRMSMSGGRRSKRMLHMHELHYDGHTEWEVDLSRQIAPGSQIPILYEPDDPSNMILGGAEDDSLYALWDKNGINIIFGLLLPAGGLFGLYCTGAFFLHAVQIQRRRDSGAATAGDSRSNRGFD